jgi:hypothetical protein
MTNVMQNTADALRIAVVTSGDSVQALLQGLLVNNPAFGVAPAGAQESSMARFTARHVPRSAHRHPPRPAAPSLATTTEEAP